GVVRHLERRVASHLVELTEVSTLGVGAGGHGSELHDIEDLTPKARPRLPEEDRPALASDDRDSHGGEHWTEDDESERRPEDIQAPFCDQPRRLAGPTADGHDRLSIEVFEVARR